MIRFVTDENFTGPIVRGLAGLSMPGVFVVNREAPISKIVEDILMFIDCSIEGE